MLILLEGVDGGGKGHTSGILAEEWQKHGTGQLPWVIHTGPPPDPREDVFVDYELPFQSGQLLERALSENYLVILDRWHLGDRIYGPRYRGFARYTEAGLLHTEMVLSSLGAVKVICSPPLEVVQKRVADRGDDYIDQEDLPRIHAEYLDHGQRYGYYFLGTQDSSQAAHHFLNDARYHTSKAQSYAKASSGTYTGSLHPDIILAGDQLGGTPELQAKRGGFTRPFTPNSSATSSEWLMSALYQTGYLNNIGLVNVNHHGVDVAQLTRLHPGVKWIALGSRASATLNIHGISHRQIPHPAWHKRFRHAFHDEYVVQLKEAMNG